MKLPIVNPNDWHYEGQWSQPTLAADFWMHWGEAKSAKKITHDRCCSNSLFFDGHYYYWKKTFDNIKKESFKSAQEKNFKYFKNYIKESLMVINNLLEIEKKLIKIKNFTTNELYIFFNYLRELMGAWNLAISISTGVEKNLEEELKKYKLNLSDISYLFKPARQPWVNIQHKKIILFVKYLIRDNSSSILKKKSINKIKEELLRKSPKIFRSIEDHLSHFAWVGTHFFQGEPLTWKRLIKEIKDELKNYPPKSQRKPKIKLPPLVMRLIEVGNELAYWRIHFAETGDHALYYIQPQFRKISRHLGIKYSEFYWYTMEEILKALENDRKLNKNTAKSRMKKFGIIYINGVERIFTGRKVDFYYNILKGRQEKTLSKLEGVVASKGYAKGKVRIVISQKAVKSFKRNEILVAPETTPNYLPAMKNAAAIITDIGGLTCHAAIVSRELGVPCIIGTKIATQVLKDGDLVEVDAEKGIVRIIKKK